MEYYVKKFELAHIFDVSEKTISRWQDLEAKALPVAKDGKRGEHNLYDLKACMAWWLNFQIEKVAGLDGKKLDVAQEAAKLNQARRTKVEIETLIIKGELCRTEEVEHYWATAANAAKTRLLSMPTTLAHVVLSATEYGEVEKIIKEAVYEALEELTGTGRPDPPPGSSASDQVERVDYAE
jgi:phage terminase Nu1 subunit (DNA packaging protein)